MIAAGGARGTTMFSDGAVNVDDFFVRGNRLKKQAWKK